MAPIPITILTGFLGSGKTTLILNLLSQLPSTYKLALLKNEFGDLAVDSLLTNAPSISSVKEILNGCICCNLVGQLGDALQALKEYEPNRIVIETSGSAFPATLAMEVNRLEEFVLDGVVVVIDVENWKGYEDTSYTAKLQARYTDLIVFSKWESCSERQYEDCLDRVGDLDVQVAMVKSDRGKVGVDVLFGLDSALAKGLDGSRPEALRNGHAEDTHGHDHTEDHQSEVEVLSLTLTSPSNPALGVDLEPLGTLLTSAPKDEVYRIKGIFSSSQAPPSSDGSKAAPATDSTDGLRRYILNWAFGRWTFTPMERQWEGKEVLRMTIVCARGEAEKWKRRIEKDRLVRLKGGEESGELKIERIS
jgi:G3E family GTPase